MRTMKQRMMKFGRTVPDDLSQKKRSGGTGIRSAKIWRSRSDKDFNSTNCIGTIGLVDRTAQLTFVEPRQRHEILQILLVCPLFLILRKHCTASDTSGTLKKVRFGFICYNWRALCTSPPERYNPAYRGYRVFGANGCNNIIAHIPTPKRLRPPQTDWLSMSLQPIDHPLILSSVYIRPPTYSQAQLQFDYDDNRSASACLRG